MNEDRNNEDYKHRNGTWEPVCCSSDQKRLPIIIQLQICSLQWQCHT